MTIKLPKNAAYNRKRHEGIRKRAQSVLERDPPGGDDTLMALASRMGVPYSTFYNQWRKPRFDLDVVYLMAEALGVTLVWLLGEEPAGGEIPRDAIDRLAEQIEVAYAKRKKE